MAKKGEKPAAPAPKEKPAKDEPREIKLAKREVQISNLNHSPEKAGKALVEKVDLTLTTLLEQGETDLFLLSNGEPASKHLWDAEGNIMFPECASFPVDLVCEGSCVFAPKGSKKGQEFDDAILKKPHLELLFGWKATLTCQVRVAPGGHLDQLGKLRIEQAAMFSFNGSAAQDEDDEDQEEMDL
jgi:hypothetical protein